MNGAHDLGGSYGMGRVTTEADEPYFHESWEARLFACQFAMNAWRAWPLDRVRWFREQMPGPQYLNSGYYEIWLDALIRLIIDARLATSEELRTGKCHDYRERQDPALKANMVLEQMLKGMTSRRETPAMTAKFSVGDRVRARNINPDNHTRLPRYVRGKRGLIHAKHGVFVFPDSNSQNLGENPQTVYGVCFKADELWGAEVHHGNDEVYVDMWETYLEEA